MIRAIFGLGNPGSKYEKTRHNAGYLLTDLLLDKFRASWKPGKGHYYCAKIRIRGEERLLIRSTTFMNESGIALMDVQRNHEIKPSEILVAYDDFALPLGTLRFRSSGSDGGHNGMNSVIYHMGTERIPRLRIGIGPLPEDGDVVSFVLDDFASTEIETLSMVLNKAVDGVIEALYKGINSAQSQYNRNYIQKIEEE